MGSIFTQTQKFVASNTSILFLAFRVIATVSGLVLFSTGLTGLYSPSKLADQFDIPLKIRLCSQKDKQNSKNINSNGDQELAKSWITACAGREDFLGSLILSLLFFIWRSIRCWVWRWRWVIWWGRWIRLLLWKGGWGILEEAFDSYCFAGLGRTSWDVS